MSFNVLVSGLRGWRENAEPQSFSASVFARPCLCRETNMVSTHPVEKPEHEKQWGQKWPEGKQRCEGTRTKQRPRVNCVREHGGSSPEVCAVQGWASEHQVRPTHWAMTPPHSSTPTNPAHPGLHPS